MRLPEPSSQSSLDVRFMGMDALDARAASWTQALSPAGGGGVPPAPQGCYFIGTSCTGVSQTCHYKCPGGNCTKKSCGWCVGFWDEPPCRAFTDPL